MVSSERTRSDLLEYTLFQIQKHNFFVYRNPILGEKLKIVIVKTDFLLVKKLEIQVIAFMIMLTCALERIFNPMLFSWV